MAECCGSRNLNCQVIELQHPLLLKYSEGCFLYGRKPGVENKGVLLKGLRQVYGITDVPGTVRG